MSLYSGLSLRSIYERACVEHACKVNSAFLKSLPESPDVFSIPTAIDLRNNFLGPKGLRPFLEVVRVCSELRLIDLSDQQLGNESIAEICAALCGHRSLCHLILTRNPGLTIAAGVSLLALAKETCRGLETIDVRETDIRPAMQTAIQVALDQNIAAKRGNVVGTSSGAVENAAPADTTISINNTAPNTVINGDTVGQEQEDVVEVEVDAAAVRAAYQRIPSTISPMLFDEDPLPILQQLCKDFQRCFADPQFPAEPASIQRLPPPPPQSTATLSTAQQQQQRSNRGGNSGSSGGPKDYGVTEWTRIHSRRLLKAYMQLHASTAAGTAAAPLPPEDLFSAYRGEVAFPSTTATASGSGEGGAAAAEGMLWLWTAVQSCLPPPSTSTASTATTTTAAAAAATTTTTSATTDQPPPQTSCWLSPHHLRSLISPPTISPIGLYSVRFFIDGKWRYVVVDDKIPTVTTTTGTRDDISTSSSSKNTTTTTTTATVFTAPVVITNPVTTNTIASTNASSHNSNTSSSHFSQYPAFWTCIFEKAVAKLHGSYQALDSTVPAALKHPFLEKIPSCAAIMRDITAGVAWSRDMHHQGFDTQEWWHTLLDLHERTSSSTTSYSFSGNGNGGGGGGGAILVAVSSDARTRVDPAGVAPNHAYRILQVRQINGFSLLQLHSPYAATVGLDSLVASSSSSSTSEQQREQQHQLTPNPNYSTTNSITRRRTYCDQWHDHCDNWATYPLIAEALGIQHKAESSASASSFWIPYHRFLHLFRSVHVCRLMPHYHQRIVEGAWGSAGTASSGTGALACGGSGGPSFGPTWYQNPHYRLSLADPRTAVLIHLSTPDARFRTSTSITPSGSNGRIHNHHHHDNDQAIGLHILRAPYYPLEFPKGPSFSSSSATESTSASSKAAEAEDSASSPSSSTAAAEVVGQTDYVITNSLAFESILGGGGGGGVNRNKKNSSNSTATSGCSSSSGAGGGGLSDFWVVPSLYHSPTTSSAPSSSSPFLLRVFTSGPMVLSHEDPERYYSHRSASFGNSSPFSGTTARSATQLTTTPLPPPPIPATGAFQDAENQAQFLLTISPNAVPAAAALAATPAAAGTGAGSAGGAPPPLRMTFMVNISKEKTINKKKTNQKKGTTTAANADDDDDTNNANDSSNNNTMSLVLFLVKRGAHHTDRYIGPIADGDIVARSTYLIGTRVSLEVCLPEHNDNASALQQQSQQNGSSLTASAPPVAVASQYYYLIPCVTPQGSKDVSVTIDAFINRDKYTLTPLPLWPRRTIRAEWATPLYASPAPPSVVSSAKQTDTITAVADTTTAITTASSSISTGTSAYNGSAPYLELWPRNPQIELQPCESDPQFVIEMSVVIDKDEDEEDYGAPPAASSSLVTAEQGSRNRGELPPAAIGFIVIDNGDRVGQALTHPQPTPSTNSSTAVIAADADAGGIVAAHHTVPHRPLPQGTVIVGRSPYIRHTSTLLHLNLGAVGSSSTAGAGGGVGGGSSSVAVSSSSVTNAAAPNSAPPRRSQSYLIIPYLQPRSTGTCRITVSSKTGGFILRNVYYM